ncbi:MAG: NADH-quinone oxidoreductase subunit A [Pseudomonadota bacterium]
MLNSFLPILLLLSVAMLFPAILLLGTSLLGPRVRTKPKLEAYECGVPPVGTPESGLPVKFYRVALLFLLLDVEAALLFPWAVLFREMIPDWGSSFLMAEFLLFFVILAVGYLYAWRRGALEWD